jgi:hypothetical protein
LFDGSPVLLYDLYDGLEDFDTKKAARDLTISLSSGFAYAVGREADEATPSRLFIFVSLSELREIAEICEML